MYFKYLVVILFLLSLNLFAQDLEVPTDPGNQIEPIEIDKPDDKPRPWPIEFGDKIYRDISEEWNNVGQSISNSIFEILTDFDICEVELGDAKFRPQVRRLVYDNFDLLDSWTVIDILRLPISLPINITSWIPFDSTNVSIGFGAAIGINAANIRQVLPKEIKNLPRTHQQKELLNEIIDSVDKINSDEETDNIDQFVKVNNDKFKKTRTSGLLGYLKDSKHVRSRYSKILNLLTHSFRLPLTEKSVLKMPVGEISTYSLDGIIELSGNIGWRYDDSMVGASLSTYLYGKYGVSIFKEDENHVQLKLTRRKTRGIRHTLGAKTKDQVIFKGFVLLGKNIMDISTEVIPFNFTVDRPVTKTFDFGYRYDLTKEHARKAYLDAVIGKFKYSQEIVDKKNSGVTQTFVREEIERARYKQYTLKLGFLFEKSRANKRKSASAIVTFPDGEYKFFTSTTQNFKGYDTLWGINETKVYTYRSTLSKKVDKDESSTDTGHVFLMEARLRDSNSTSIELYDYINEVETAIGDFELFPEFPIWSPENKDPPTECLENKRQNQLTSHDCSQYNQLIRYGSSSFLYRLGLTEDQLKIFINFSKNEMWSVLEKSFSVREGVWKNSLFRSIYSLKYSLLTIFNIPLSLVDLHIKQGSKLIQARSFYSKWKKLAKIVDLEQLAMELGSLFSTTNFNFELIKTVKAMVENEKLSFYMNAHNDMLFGQISKNGEFISTIDEIINEVDERIDYDRYGPKPNYNDYNAVISLLSSDIESSNIVKITFYLPAIPRHVYFRVDSIYAWKPTQNISKFTMANEGQFQVGKNEIMLKKGNLKTALQKRLYKSIIESKTNSNKKLSLAISIKESSWGPVVSTEIRTYR